jgi:segregation and condensation protein B
MSDEAEQPGMSDQAERPAGSDRPQDLRLLEALLFAAAEPLDEATLATRLPEGADIAALLGDLVEIYRNRGVTLEKVAGRWAFRTAADLAPRLMLERLVSRKLSRAAIETLAIIAYHQPVTRTEVEEIRGVIVNRGILDTLMESGWIRPKGHKQTPGRPATWVTTPEFLVHFGLDGLADLPGMDELKAAGLLDARPAAALADFTGEAASAEPADDGEDVDGDDDADIQIDDIEAPLSDPEPEPPAPS